MFAMVTQASLFSAPFSNGSIMPHRFAMAGVFGFFLIATARVEAQLTQTTTPQQRFGSGYFEQSGIQWSLRGNNFFANSGGGVMAPFGNSAPGAGLSAGFGFGGGGVNGSLGFNFAQGSSRTITSTSPSITTMNGYPGSISVGTIRPFVTGVTPVIGGYSYGQPVNDNVSTQMFQSQQHTQAMELRSRVEAARDAKQAKAEEAFRRAVKEEADGNLRIARANYRKALAMDQGPLRLQILARMRARGWN